MILKFLRWIWGYKYDRCYSTLDVSILFICKKSGVIKVVKLEGRKHKPYPFEWNTTVK